MKNTIFLKNVGVFLLGFSIVSLLYADEQTLTKSIASKIDRYRVEQGKGIANYIVQSDTTMRCDLSFLALPAGDTLGGFYTYMLAVNGILLPDVITFTKPGWQEVCTTNGEALLNKGENLITFTSSGRNLPQIRQIERYNEARRTTFDTNIRSSFPTPLNAIAQKSGNLSIASNVLNSTNSFEILFRPGVQLNCSYSYTFFLPLQYEAGDRASFYSPTPNDPRFGRYTSSVDYHLYFFHENPELFSDSQTSNNKYLSWTVDIVYPGTYYVLLEAKNIEDFDAISKKQNIATLCNTFDKQ